MDRIFDHGSSLESTIRDPLEILEVTERNIKSLEAHAIMAERGVSCTSYFHRFYVKHRLTNHHT